MLTRFLETTLPSGRKAPVGHAHPEPAQLRAGRRLARIARRIAEAHRDARVHEQAPAELQPRRLAYGLSRVFADLCEIQAIRPRVSGSVPQSPVILVANHVGYIDPVILAGILPAMPISKVEVGSWPVLGRVARRYGVAFVERGDPMSGARALLRARRALDLGLSVLNFPEGTTTRGDTVLPFKRGIFGLARRLHVPVVPVALQLDDPDMSWVGDDPFLPHYLKSLAREEIGLQVRFGCPMSAERYRSADDLAVEAHAMTEHLLAGS